MNTISSIRTLRSINNLPVRSRSQLPLMVSRAFASSQVSKSSSRAQVQPLRGTKDLFPNESRYFNYITNNFINVLRKYGYFNEIRTPILEHQSVFDSTLGDTSDVVMKQMYSFDDNGVPTVLRPENTAGVVRAVLHRGTAPVPTSSHDPIVDEKTGDRLQPNADFSYNDRLYYVGPMFRRERPQAGRYRQFTQFGIESLGTDSIAEDAAIILMAHEALAAVGIRNEVTLKINSIGDSEDRQRYRVALVEYYEQFKHLLSDDSVKRLESGVPERILDSKSLQDKFVSLGAESFANVPESVSFLRNFDTQGATPPGAPVISDYLSEASFLRFQALLGILAAHNIQLEHDKLLFRGLDYYCHTAFEFIVKSPSSNPTENVVSQSPIVGSAVLAGGRYNNLSTRFAARSGKGVVEMAGIGWAAGLERIFSHLEFTQTLPHLVAPTDVVVVGMTFKVKDQVLYHTYLAEISNDPSLVPFKDSERALFDQTMLLIQNRAKNVNEVLKQDKNNIAGLAEAQALVDYASITLSSYLRKLGLSCQMNTDKPFRQQLGVAMTQLNCRHAVVIGTNELESGTFLLKDSLKSYIDNFDPSSSTHSPLKKTQDAIQFLSQPIDEFVKYHYE